VKFFSKAFLLVACLAVATVAQAQATRTWVSGVGDAVNPCSRTAPCKTFAGAISKTATGGEIDALDPAGFGTLTITKSITIDGGSPGNGSILATGGITGIIVNSSTAQVVIRNLNFTGATGSPSGAGGTGINVISALSVHLQNVFIDGFSGSCVNFHPSTTAFLFISDSKFTRCAGGGVLVDGTSTFQRASILRTVSDQNLFGFKAFSQALVDISDSSAAVAGDSAFFADGANARILAVNSQANLSAVGVKAANSAQVRFTGSIAHNTTSTQNLTGGVVDSTGAIIVVFP